MTAASERASGRARVVEASAPAGVELAGVVLGLRAGGGRGFTLSLAVDRRVECVVATDGEGVRVESKDTSRREQAATVAELLAGPEPSLVARILERLRVETGIQVATHSRVPGGLGVDGDSALAVAVTAAVATVQGRALAPDGVARLSAGDGDVLEDHETPVRGGMVARRFEPGCAEAGLGATAERLAVDPARLEESLLLLEAGPAAAEGWRSLESALVRAGGGPSLQALADGARDLGAALVEGRYPDVGPLIVREWQLRRDLFPGSTSAEVERVVAMVMDAGGAARPCHGPKGGLVAAWTPPGARTRGAHERLLDALRASGRRAFTARLDLRGLEVEERTGPPSSYNAGFSKGVNG